MIASKTPLTDEAILRKPLMGLKYVNASDCRTIELRLAECVEALECAEVGMCAVGVPNTAERAVLVDSVQIVRKAIANARRPIL